ncbi:hypothetical protein [Paraburkholderia sp. GAS32]|uniref:hypothetical protein n=1 Tax=Paraburkholderia sp. GAS32 TaxID=3035129 RepID=UPI003D251216
MTSRRLPKNRVARRRSNITTRVVPGATSSAFEEITRVAGTIGLVPIVAVALQARDSPWRHSVAGSSAKEWMTVDAEFALLMAGDRHRVDAISVANDPELAWAPLIASGHRRHRTERGDFCCGTQRA